MRSSRCCAILRRRRRRRGRCCFFFLSFLSPFCFSDPLRIYWAISHVTSPAPRVVRKFSIVNSTMHSARHVCPCVSLLNLVTSDTLAPYRRIIIACKLHCVSPEYREKPFSESQLTNWRGSTTVEDHWPGGNNRRECVSPKDRFSPIAFKVFLS